MEQEDKELLLKDLCVRLPYEVKCEVVKYDADGEMLFIRNGSAALTLTVDNIKELVTNNMYQIKPYLFPLSSMTEEQCYELSSIRSGFQDCWKYIKTPIPLSICNFEQIDWFHKNHLDYRGLIPMGLAIDATGLNIY